jgi:protein-S-isoprenylcysteine O-methyltransferase Ste14
MTTNPKPNLTFIPANLLKPVAYLFYLAIGLEILFMISPAAFYFYASYGPVLSVLNHWAATSWLTQFFLPHISTTRSAVLNALPWVGGISLLIGAIVFLAAAMQIYGAKLRRRGLVTTGLYGYCRHPQYVGLAVLGLGALLLWPRFLVLIAYLLMLFLYRSLAALEECRCKTLFGARYRDYEEHTQRFLAFRLPRDDLAIVSPVEGGNPWMRFSRSASGLIAGIAFCVVLAFGAREYSLASISALYQDHAAVLSPALLSDRELLAAYHTALKEIGDRQVTYGIGEAPLLVHVVPEEWHLADLPLETKSVHGGHETPADFDRRYYKVLFSRARSHDIHATGKNILRSAYGLEPLQLVEVDIESGRIIAANIPPEHVRWGDIPTPLF